MQEISSLVRQRLAARQAPQTHPDPDLLTAYVEQALGERERSQVIDHLAACSQCREVVSLSLAEQPVEAVAARPSTVRGRFWLPAFRWTAVAATIAIAAALVVEKPWHHTDNPETQFAQKISNEAPATPAAQSTNSISPEKSAATASGAPARPTSRGEAQDSLGLTASEPKSAERPEIARAKAPGVASGLVGGVPIQAEAPRPVITTLAAAPSAAPPPVALAKPVISQTAADAASLKDTQRDYVNESLIKNQAANQTVEVSAQAPAIETSNTNGLPLAPAAKQARSSEPAITASKVEGSAFDVKLQPPVMGGPPAPQTSNQNTLDTMSFTAKVSKKIKDGAKGAMAKIGGAPPSVASGFASSMASPDLKLAETDQEAKPESLQFHWRVTSDGILQKSNDLSHWHEAYPQGGDLQFRSFFTMGQGHQVWAGGNNGTLIHSWNGGVKWDTLKVPEANGSDITSISIDDGWQIKTSNGQTFVSHDQGKTWVPLRQN